MSYTHNSGSATLQIDRNFFGNTEDILNYVVDRYYEIQPTLNQYDSLYNLGDGNRWDIKDSLRVYVQTDLSADVNDNEILITYDTEENNYDYEVFEFIIETLCKKMTSRYVRITWACDDSREGISSGESYLDSSGTYHDAEELVNANHKSVSEQIQEDIISYASSVDAEGIFFTQDVVDALCQIVVDNFNRM